MRVHSGSLATEFSGFVAVGVDTSAGLTELARLDHGRVARDHYCNSGSVDESVYGCANRTYLHAANPRRSVFMRSGGEDFVYTLSDIALMSASVADFAVPLVSLPLPPPEHAYWVEPAP